MSERPIIKLRPDKGRRLATGAPWAFADEIAMDRRTRNLTPGTIAELVDGDRSLGLVAFNPESQIAVRLLDTARDARIDQDWLSARLRRAMVLRETLYDTPFYRLIHAEGDGLPGVVIDRFGGAAVIQPNAAWADLLLDDLVEALAEVTGCTTIVVNATARVRKLEGLVERLGVVRGTLEGPVEVQMNGAIYLADLTGGQKTGLYFDQRPNHAFAQNFARKARVLDVFSHVGGFGLATLAAGAARALAIDSSNSALALAREAASRMTETDRYETQRADAFEALEALRGESFDMVICDPPAFAPSKSTLANGLRAYERLARLAASVVVPGGILCLCSCSHAAGVDAFHRASVTGIRKAGRAGALIYSGRAGPDHPVHIGLPETGYLKALFFRLDG